ncbi:MAG TPA: hypothetical protein VGL44_10635 [Gaiellales bacterium]|jgi:hypothetical protein
MADAVFFIAAFGMSMALAALIERIGEWIGGLRSGGTGGMEPWRWRPMPPRPRPHGGSTARRRRSPRVGSGS